MIRSSRLQEILQKVEDREMLNVFAEAHAACVGAYGDAELCGEQHDGEILIDAGNATAIDLADVDGASLHELLEHDGIVTVLPCGNTGRSGLAADTGVAEDVVRAGGLFHPPGLELGEFPGSGRMHP